MLPWCPISHRKMEASVLKNSVSDSPSEPENHRFTTSKMRNLFHSQWLTKAVIQVVRWGEVFPNSGEIPAIFHGITAEEKLNYLRVRNEARFTDTRLEFQFNLEQKTWIPALSFKFKRERGKKPSFLTPQGVFKSEMIQLSKGSELERKHSLKEGLRGVSPCRDAPVPLNWS